MRSHYNREAKARKRRRHDEQQAAAAASAAQQQQHHHHLTTVAGRCVSVSERYEKLGRLGEGTYGVVYKARDRITNKLVALKRCIPHYESSDGFPITTLREIHSLRACHSHPNVVHLEQVAVSKRSNGVFLVLEHCEYDLADLVDDHYGKHHTSPFTEAGCKRLVMQLLSALEFLHAHHIIHRDIKLSNLLYTTTSTAAAAAAAAAAAITTSGGKGGGGLLKLADFGLSRCYANSSHVALTPTVASLWYRPPELLLGAKTYNATLDTWASGCIFAELLKGIPLFTGKNELDQMHQIMQRLGVPSSQDWPGLADMPLIQNGTIQLLPTAKTTIQRRSILDDFSFLSSSGLRLLLSLLAYNPDKRLSAETAAKSPYFTEDPLPTPVDQMPRFRKT